MASRTLPGIGLKGDWDLGEDGWKDEMDVNLRVLSVLAGQQVLEIVAAEPGAPAEGDIVILDDTHATHPNEIAAYDEAAWRYIVPVEGMQLHNLDDGRRYTFTSGAWVPPAAGSAWKEPVRVATTAAIVLATGIENGDTIDGVVLATGDRILVKNQAAGAENGIYIVPAAGAPARASDCDTGVELISATVKVSEGSTQADTQWQCTNNATITLGTTALVWAQQVSGSAMPSGVAFPGSPTAGDEFNRTDRGIKYTYDGTRWLSQQYFTIELRHEDGNLPVIATSFFRAPFPWAGLYSIYVDRVMISSNNTAATPATNYFTARFNTLDGAASANVGAVLSTQNDAINTWFAHPDAPGVVIASTVDALMMTVTEVGNASTYLIGSMVYRLIG